MLQVIIPSRWVVTAPQLANRGPAQYRFQPAPHAAGGLRHLTPDRLQHLHDQRQIDLRNRQPPNGRVHILRERLIPLCRRCRRPSRFMACNVIASALFECAIAGLTQHLLIALLPLQCQRVIAVQQCKACLASFGTRRREADEWIGTEPHIVRLTEALVAEDPRLRLPLGNLEMHTISDTVSAGLLDLRYRRCSFHCSTPLATTQEAQSITHDCTPLEEQSASCWLFMRASVLFR